MNSERPAAIALRFARRTLALVLLAAGTASCRPREAAEDVPLTPQQVEQHSNLEQASVDEGPLFRELVGLNVKFGQGQPLTDLPMLVDLGVSWARDHVNWGVVEPVAGKYVPFPPDFQRRLAFYREHDIGVVFLLAYQNTTAYPPTAAAPFRQIDPAAFGRYAAEAARQLKAAGVRFVLEIWNEPHNFVIRQLLGGSWNGKPPAPWLTHYVRMTHEAVRQVKAIDPGIKLLSDDDMWVIHYWFLEAGLPKNLDGFAVHPYSLGIPELAAVTQDTDWVKPFVVVDADGSVQSAVRRLRNRGTEKLARTPEMWITEWGYRLEEATREGVVTEQLIATYLPRAYITAKAAGVQALCWFSARDSVDGKMGLLANDGTRRRSYTALKTLSANLGDAVYVGQLTGKDHPTRGVQSFLFRSESSRTLVVWNIGPGTARLRLPGELGAASLRDVDGVSVAPERDATGVASLAIGASPIYVRVAGHAGTVTPDWLLTAASDASTAVDDAR